MDFPNLPDETPETLISFHFDDVEFDLPDTDKLEDWLLDVAGAERKQLVEVNYIFCSDERLRQMNVQFLDHDYFTDIITFPYDDEAVHGDIFISSERVADNAVTHGVTFEHELCRVLVHGVLHLAGYLDKSPEDEQVMRAKEDFYLERILGELLT